MKVFTVAKDGGRFSRVWGYWLIECKSLFSVVLLHFKYGTREAYHTHAFNSLSWILRGKLEEHLRSGETNVYTPSWRPVLTYRSTFHKVFSHGDTWAISFRGPWVNCWKEYLPVEKRTTVLTHGRRIVQSHEV